MLFCEPIITRQNINKLFLNVAPLTKYLYLFFFYLSSLFDQQIRLNNQVLSTELRPLIHPLLVHLLIADQSKNSYTCVVSPRYCFQALCYARVTILQAEKQLTGIPAALYGTSYSYYFRASIFTSRKPKTGLDL